MSNVPSGPPPVEPMSDLAWARVERGLMQRLDAELDAPSVRVEPTRRRWLWLAAPALAVAAVIALVIGLRTGAGPVGTPEPSRVVAGDAPSSVSFADAHLALAARSAIVMTQEAGSPSVLLERGRVALTVAPRAQRPPFVVRAGDVVVRVVGTKFEVARYEERVTVAVDHGIVDVVFRGTTVRVGAGQRWNSENPDTVATIALADPPASTTPAPTTPATTTPTSTTTATTTTDRTSAAPARPEKPAAKLATPATTSTTAPIPGNEPEKAVRPVDEQREFERLAALEPKDPAAAISGYLAISRGSSEWASNALFAAGRLAADRKDPRARTFLGIYLRRFPNGRNAADARTLLDRLQGATP